MQRPITSGSRQAPDPYDQFLEEHNLYRKHTARDASCLFRVISEQMYDTQMLHVDVRQECVRYMTQNRGIFAHYVDRDFDQYLLDLAKPKTLGTLLELRALSYMYKRNVLMYQPFDMGNYFVLCNDYKGIFRVFYTYDFHFDSVFIAAFIQEAALCQSISYDLLYRMFFKIPDVEFAVEKMLHPCSLSWGAYQVEYDINGYLVQLLTVAGRMFQLDLPEKTSCILQNYKLCRFHCNSNSSLLENNSSEEINSIESNTENESKGMLLPHRMISCVRQLLDDGITPFPYKVAKSLDPNMYRNIEFDSWNEMRKEVRRFSVYKGDNNYKIGAKCYVKLWPTDEELYTCYVQDITKDKRYYVVYVEKLGEKHMVSFESLSPLPPNEFKPWTLPVRIQRHFSKMNSSKYTSKSRSNWKKNKFQDFQDNDNSVETINNNDSFDCFKFKSFMPFDNYRPPQINYLTYPVAIDRPLNMSNVSSNNSDKHNVEGNEHYNERMGRNFTNNQSAITQGDEVVPFDIVSSVCEETRVMFNINTVNELGQQPTVGTAAGQLPPIGVVDPATVPPFIMMPGGFHSPFPGYELPLPVYPTNIPACYLEEFYNYPQPQPTVQHEYSPYMHLSGCYQSNFQGNIPFVHMPPQPTLSNYPVDVALVPSHLMMPSNSSMPPLVETQPSANYSNQVTSTRNTNNFGSIISGNERTNATNCPTYSTRTGSHNSNGEHLTYQGTPTLAVSPSYVLTNHGSVTANNNLLSKSTDDYVPESGMLFPSNGRVNVNANRSVRTNGQDLPGDVPTMRYFFNLGVEYHNIMFSRIANCEQNNIPLGDRNRILSSQSNNDNIAPAPEHSMRISEVRSETALTNNENNNGANANEQQRRSAPLAILPASTGIIQNHNTQNSSVLLQPMNGDLYARHANADSSKNPSKPGEYVSNIKSECSNGTSCEDRCDDDATVTTQVPMQAAIPMTPQSPIEGTGVPPIFNSSNCAVNVVPMPSAPPPPLTTGNNFGSFVFGGRSSDICGGGVLMPMPPSSYAIYTALPQSSLPTVNNRHNYSTPNNTSKNNINTRHKPSTFNETKCSTNKGDNNHVKNETTQHDVTAAQVKPNGPNTIINMQNVGKKMNSSSYPGTQIAFSDDSNKKCQNISNNKSNSSNADRDVQAQTSTAITTMTTTNSKTMTTLKSIPAGRTYAMPTTTTTTHPGNYTAKVSLDSNENVIMSDITTDNIVCRPNIETNHFVPSGSGMPQPQLFTCITYPMQASPMSEPLPRPTSNEPVSMPIYYSPKNGPPNLPMNATTICPATGQQQTPIQLMAQQNGYWYPYNGQRPPLTYPPLNLPPSPLMLNTTNKNDNVKKNGVGS